MIMLYAYLATYSSLSIYRNPSRMHLLVNMNRIILHYIYFDTFRLCLNHQHQGVTIQGTIQDILYHCCRSQWPRGLRRRSTAARLLRSWVRIPPGAWKSVCCECCVLSGRGLCDEPITYPEESYRLRCVVVCDLETSRMRRSWPALGRNATGKNTVSF